MEIAYDLSEIFEEPIQKIDRSFLLRYNPRKCWAVAKLIDGMGELSSSAQGLKRVLTTYNRILDHDEEQRLYIMWRPGKENSSTIMGLLKVGRKHLYLLDGTGRKQYEENPLCVLDFYVHESIQRQGHGHTLFEFMLKSEEADVASIAIDRPSEALVQFMLKFYNLIDPVWQNTNFVVYPQFFEDKKTTTVEEASARRGARSDKAGWMNNSPRTPRNSSRSDNASGIIHCTAPIAERQEVGPDTPKGRKNTRDFGHTMIW